eukprot:1158279-Pelagomonas_calceolata.AAC.1
MLQVLLEPGLFASTTGHSTVTLSPAHLLPPQAEETAPQGASVAARPMTSVLVLWVAGGCVWGPGASDQQARQRARAPRHSAPVPWPPPHAAAPAAALQCRVAPAAGAPCAKRPNGPLQIVALRAAL